MTQENTTLHFNPIDESTSHNIRLIAFVNGLFVVAQIVEATEGVISVILPMEVFLECDEEDDSIRAYEFAPYLENLQEFDINRPVKVLFNINMVLSCTVPSRHLIRNYYGQLLYMKRVQDDLDGVCEEESKTIH